MAKTALTMVNLEVGLDYWLPGDAHLARAAILDGRHPAASSPAPPPSSPWPGPSRPCRGLDLWKSRGESGRCPIYLRSLDILIFSCLQIKSLLKKVWVQNLCLQPGAGRVPLYSMTMVVRDMGWVNLDLGNSHLPRQNLADSGMTKNIVNPTHVIV